MVAAKAKKTKDENRPVKYPKRLKSPVGEFITVQKAMELLGWEEEKTPNEFGTDYLFEYGKLRVRCTNNVTNRPLYWSNVETLRRDILNKSWKYNAEPIIIGTTGLVLNGQHTLISLVLAERERTGSDKHHWSQICDGPITLDKDVTYGVNEDDATVNTMDTCKPRTLMDVLYRSEYFKDLPTSERKAVARACSYAIQLLWMRTGAGSMGFVGGDKGKHTHAEYLDFLERHPRLLDAVRHIHKENASNAIAKYLTVGYSSAIMYLMAASGSDGEAYHFAPDKSERLINFDYWDKAHNFWVQLAKGAEEFAEVRYALGALTDETTGAVASKDEKIAVLALAWDEYREGVNPTKLGCTLDMSDPDPDGIRHVTKWPDFGGIDKGQEVPEVKETKKKDEDADDGTGGEQPDDEPAEDAKPKAKINKGPDPDALKKQLADLRKKHPDRVLAIRTEAAWVLWEEDAEAFAEVTGRKIVEKGGLKCGTFKPEEMVTVAEKMAESGKRMAMCYPSGKEMNVQDYEPKPKTQAEKPKAKPGDKPAGAKPGGKKPGDVLRGGGTN